MTSPQTQPNSATRAPASDARPRDTSPSLPRFVVTLVLLAWVLRSFIIAPFSIPSGSMIPTLYIGDYVIVSKWPFGYSRYSFPFGIPSFEGRVFGAVPTRGDIVVFRHPGENIDLIKRVIGLPGDTVAVEQGRLILNGQPVSRTALPPYRLPVSANTPCTAVPPAIPSVTTSGGRAFCLFRAYREALPGGPSYIVLDQLDAGPADNFPATLVPPGRLFLMGDNRDDSLDSRFAADQGGAGMVGTENLIGRALFTFWSTDGSASYWKPWTWFTSLRTDRIGRTGDER
ncbi:MAG: signal peptidase I [Sphingomicrobium sp.]